MIRVTMQDQGWNVDLFEIFGGVGLRECFDAVVDPFDRSVHFLEPEAISNALRNLGISLVVSGKGNAHILDELRAVSD